MSDTVTLEWSIELSDGTEVMYDIECDVTPGTPDITSGPPDNWEQGTGPECEITSIKLQGLGKQPGIEINYRLWPLLGFTKDILESIEEKAFEQFADMERDYQERDED